jgi:hypothetical protein
MQGNLKSLQDKISDLQKKLSVVEKPVEKLYNTGQSDVPIA